MRYLRVGIFLLKILTFCYEKYKYQKAVNAQDHGNYFPGEFNPGFGRIM